MSTEVSSAAKQTIDYMTLMVTELQNQNPLEPMDNQQMAAQLAQFSQLELTEDMNTNLDTMNTTMSSLSSNFESVLWLADLNYAKSLIGKTVTFTDSESGNILEGKVKKLSFEDGSPVLTVETEATSTQEAKQYTVSTGYIEGIQE